MLSHLHSLVTQFLHEITGGEARKEIWSSVHYLFFLSTSLIYRKSWQVRQSIVWLKDLQCVLRPELIRIWGCLITIELCWSDKKGGFLLRAVSCKELPIWWNYITDIFMDLLSRSLWNCYMATYIPTSMSITTIDWSMAEQWGGAGGQESWMTPEIFLLKLPVSPDLSHFRGHRLLSHLPLHIITEIQL